MPNDASSNSLTEHFEPAHSPAASNAIQVMQDRGIDISQHRSKMLTVDEFNQAKHVLVMTREHATRLGKPNTVVLEIPDPWHQTISIYQETANALKEKLQDCIQTLEK